MHVPYLELSQSLLASEFSSHSVWLRFEIASQDVCDYATGCVIPVFNPGCPLLTAQIQGN